MEVSGQVHIPDAFSSERVFDIHGIGDTVASEFVWTLCNRYTSFPRPDLNIVLPASSLLLYRLSYSASKVDFSAKLVSASHHEGVRQSGGMKPLRSGGELPVAVGCEAESTPAWKRKMFLPVGN
jgi:hypothetical protein